MDEDIKKIYEELLSLKNYILKNTPTMKEFEEQINTLKQQIMQLYKKIQMLEAKINLLNK